MRRTDICEIEGSGIDKAIEGAEAAHLPPLEFRAADDETNVIVRGYTPFVDLAIGERVRACHQHSLARREKGDPMTNASLRKRFGLPADQSQAATRVIKAAIERGLIRPDPDSPGRKFARYLPA